MISYLQGKILYKEADAVICLVADIGYHIHVSSFSLQKLCEGDFAKLWIIETLRDQQVVYFGFLEAEEKKWFSWLCALQGISGKMALNILSALRPHQLRECILNQELHLLKAAEGIGPKLASRILHELKDKALRSSPASCLSQDAPFETIPISKDVQEALIQLGYSKNQAQTVLEKILKKESFPKEAPALLQDCLRELFAHGH